MADLTQLERKLHGYQVVLWLKQTYEEAVATDEGAQDDDAEDGGCHVAAETAEDRIVAPSASGCVSKSSVYKAYVEMCAREGRPTMFTRAVVGKMVKRAFPDVRTKRRGPRGRVTQHYIGLRPINARNNRHSGGDAEDGGVQLREDEASVAAVREPTPDTAPCADFQPTPMPRCADTAWRQHESGFNVDVNTVYHHTYDQQTEELDYDPGLSGSGEWPATAFIAPSVTGRARHERRHASLGHARRPIDATPPQPQPSLPLSSSSWSAASSSVWAPYLPSTLAAMGAHTGDQLAFGADHASSPQHHHHHQQQQMEPLENLESLWDWRHASVDVWQPPVFDITLATTTACEEADLWPSPHQPQPHFSRGGSGLFEHAGEDPESFLSSVADILTPNGRA